MQTIQLVVSGVCYNRSDMADSRDRSKRPGENRSLYLYKDQIEWLEESAKRLHFRGVSAYLRELLDNLMEHENPVDLLPPPQEEPALVEPETKNFVGISEAAEMKGVHRQTIRQAVLTGRLKAYQSGGIWLVDLESLSAYTPAERNYKKKA